MSRLLGANDQRFLDIEARLEKLASRLDSQREQLQRQRESLDSQKQRLDKQRERLARQVEAQAEMTAEIAKLVAAYPVLEHQMSSFEMRLQALLDAAATGPVTATDAEQGQARDLLEEVRREHSRIRVRFGVISRYEERMRRLEAAIAPVPEAYAPLNAGVASENQMSEVDEDELSSEGDEDEPGERSTD